MRSETEMVRPIGAKTEEDEAMRTWKMWTPNDRKAESEVE